MGRNDQQGGELIEVDFSANGKPTNRADQIAAHNADVEARETARIEELRAQMIDVISATNLSEVRVIGTIEGEGVIRLRP